MFTGVVSGISCKRGRMVCFGHFECGNIRAVAYREQYAWEYRFCEFAQRDTVRDL